MIERDDVYEEYSEKLGTPHGSPVEVVVFSLSDFEQAVALGSENEWDRYS